MAARQIRPWAESTFIFLMSQKKRMVRVNQSCGVLNYLCGVVKSRKSYALNMHIPCISVWQNQTEERDDKVGVISWVLAAKLFLCLCLLAQTHRHPDGGVSNGLQWVCGAAVSHLSQHIKPAVLAGGLSRQLGGGAAVLYLCEEEMWLDIENKMIFYLVLRPLPRWQRKKYKVRRAEFFYKLPHGKHSSPCLMGIWLLILPQHPLRAVGLV